MNRTHITKPSEIERAWYLVDATGMPIGRLASQVAQILRGKHKPTFNYHTDCGDFVVVINASKAVWTGNNKGDDLVYWHSGFPGGIKNVSRGEMLETKPVKSIERVVKGMLPKGPLGDQMYTKLKVYEGTEHPHEAQGPVQIDLKGLTLGIDKVNA